MSNKPSLVRGDLVTLRGPLAGDVLALVLFPTSNRRPKDSSVVVAPVVRGMTRADASNYDVICPPDTTSFKETLVIAAWATASMSREYLDQKIGRLEDEEMLAAIRDVRLSLVDRSVRPQADFLGQITIGSERLRWQDQLSEGLEPYWRGGRGGDRPTYPET